MLLKCLKNILFNVESFLLVISCCDGELIQLCAVSQYNFLKKCNDLFSRPTRN